MTRSAHHKLTCLLVVPLFLMLVNRAWSPRDSRADGDDSVGDALYRTYVAPNSKINSSVVHAAEEILADRWRASGNWRKLLAELPHDELRGDSSAEVKERNTVDTLALMLAVDGKARAIKRSADPYAGTWVPTIELGNDVLLYLVRRGSIALEQRWRVSRSYLRALAWSQADEAQVVLRTALTGDRRGQDDVLYVAAVGLALRGDAAGMEWLIEHARSGMYPSCIANCRPKDDLLEQGCLSCPLVALRRFSGQETLTTEAEWRQWWAGGGKREFTDRLAHRLE